VEAPADPRNEPRPGRGFSFAGGTGRGAALEAAGLGLLLGVLYVAGLLAFGHAGPFTDEVDHFAQIALFRRGEFRILSDYLTTIPGYHALVAALLRLAGADSLAAARTLNALFGLLAAAGFHAVRRRAWPGTETIATAQFLALPILAPLFFLVYTDVLALALVLWATWATLARRHALSALLLVLLLGVRQHEVVWTVLLAAIAAREAGGARPAPEARTLAWRLLPYAAPVLAFLAFWGWNGSISLSRTQAALHPDLALHAGNLWLALLLAGLLMPLQVVAGFRGFLALLPRWKWLAAVPVLLALAFWHGFVADNPYNTALPGYYLHNALPHLLAGNATARAAAAMIAAAAACALAPTRLRPAGAVALYPVAALFLAASWLVEFRYALVPLVLWLALREQRSRRAEYATLALWLALAVLMVAGTVSHRFFP
jgi:alpha-1,2-glucosyltransferase